MKPYEQAARTVEYKTLTLPSGLTVLVRPMPGYSAVHAIYATKFGAIDRDFKLDGKEVHLPAGVATLTLQLRPFRRSRESSDRKSKCTMTAWTGGL